MNLFSHSSPDSTAPRIEELLERDLRRKIEEIIQVDQTDEASVYEELTEYVATTRIKEQYHELLMAIAGASADPSEAVGIWISGFFGSGKSSFAKNLGYTLTNPTICGVGAAELFKTQIGESTTSAVIDSILTRFPTESIMFDVSKGSDLRQNDNDPIAHIVYRALLKHLDYAPDYELAELEMQLESEGRLAQFEALCPELDHGKPWEMTRLLSSKFNVASAILHRLDPQIYASSDSWAATLQGQRHILTVPQVVERSFDLMTRRRPGKALIFVIDEVGQYVARSSAKMEDLRALVEEFGKQSKNRLKKRQTLAPIWIAVTSQERLDEVVSALEGKKVELAKLRDRFRHTVDLAPADIREVASKRVLAKKSDALPLLNTLFEREQGALALALRLERTARRSEFSGDEFAQFYPYPPHFIQISIDVLSGIRNQVGATKQLGGSNRTVISQIYQMLVLPRTDFKNQRLGALVTLDRVYDLIEGEIRSETRNDISAIGERFTEDPWCLRVAKVVCLLGFVHDLPRTPANIAACLVDVVGHLAPIEAIKIALETLRRFQYVREEDSGWKLQTTFEKNWATQRAEIEIKPRERLDIERDAVRSFFEEKGLSPYRYANLRSFLLGLTIENLKFEDGKIAVSVHLADDESALEAKITELRVASREKNGENTLFWVFCLSKEIDDLVAARHGSKTMIAKFDRLKAANRISQEESACLSGEHSEATRLKMRLVEKMAEAMACGTGLFRGVSSEGADLGNDAPAALKAFFAKAVPDLYPKLEIGAKPVKSTLPVELLKAATLQSLDSVAYDSGLNLVVKEGTTWVVNTGAPVAKEILDYLIGQVAYGERDTRTGKALESHFGGQPYGWESDVVRLALAALLRAGALEGQSSGGKVDSHGDPRTHQLFGSLPQFRGALWTPRTPLTLRTLTQAVEHLEELSGQTVDPEQGAITTAFETFASGALLSLAELSATARAHALKSEGWIEEWRLALTQMRGTLPEERVKRLAGEGKSLAETHARARSLAKALTPSNLALLTQARRVLSSQWPLVQTWPDTDTALETEASQAQTILSDEDFTSQALALRTAISAISAVYTSHYEDRHAERFTLYQAAMDDLEGRPQWTLLAPELRTPLLNNLQSRACEISFAPGWALEDSVCKSCHASFAQLESDIAAASVLHSQALSRLLELTAPKPEPEARNTPQNTNFEAAPDATPKPPRRVALAQLVKTAIGASSISSSTQVEIALDALRAHLLMLLESGETLEIE